MKRIAIITARGGSKRIPKKNIKKFLGKPIIGYSIETALNSNLFDEVMVSTDSQEIAEVAKQFGAKVPFFRSVKNSNDYSTTSDVLLEVLNEYKLREVEYDTICCIYPTAPFISINLLDSLVNKVENEGYDSALPVVEFGFPIQRALKKVDGKIHPISFSDYQKRSQDLEPRYHDVGQCYVFNNTFLQNKQLIMDNSYGLVISNLDAQDIDTEIDWKLAELKYQLQKK